MFGFGIDVPYVKNMTQVIGHPVADGSGTCGDPWALQQMLAELGFYAGQVDGQIGPQSLTAVRQFAEALGVSYTKGTFPKAPVCQAIITAWTAKMAATPPSTVTTSTAPSKGPTYTIAQRKRIIDMIQRTGTYSSSMAIDSGPLEKMGAWWGEQTTVTKVAVVGGGVAVVGGIAYLAFGKKKATPNRRRRRR